MKQKHKNRVKFRHHNKYKLKKCKELVDTKYLNENNCLVQNEIRRTKLLKHKLQTNPKFIPYYIVEEILHKRKRIWKENVMYKPTEKVWAIAKVHNYLVVLEDIVKGIETNL